MTTSSVDKMELSGREILAHAIDHNFAASNKETDQRSMESRIEAHRIMSAIEWNILRVIR